MAGRVGPVLAGLLTMGALAGAVVAERTATFPRPAADVAPAGIDANGCPLNSSATSAARVVTDPTDGLVPLAPVSASVCRYASGPALLGSIRLDGLATARLAAVFNGLTASPLPHTSLPAGGGLDTPSWLIVFHYGVRSDVTVTVNGNGVTNGQSDAQPTRDLELGLYRLTAG